MPKQALLAFPKYIDAPPSRNTGMDTDLANDLDVYWNNAAEYESRPQRYIKVSFERVCYYTRPELTERIDVMVLPSAEHDLHDRDKALAARDHYRAAARGEMHRLPHSAARPGFSSWGYDLAAVEERVKVLADRFDDDIDRMRAEEAETQPSP